MKKIIFNGCSFMAGDEIAWEQYSREVGNTLTWDDFCSKTKIKTDVENNIWLDYQHVYKRNRNLPQFVINSLGLSTDNKIDISADGRSNDIISMSTINYILNIPPNERKNYHVVIGWTSLYRVMKYTSKYKNFMNLNIHHIDNPVTGAEDFIDYIKATLVNADNEDIALNYFKNVIMLENFLVANNITYTFYRAIGSEHDCTMREHNFDSREIGQLQVDKISNFNNWIKFYDTDTNPVVGKSWTSLRLNDSPEYWIHDRNPHPNTKAAMEMAAFIKNKMLEQQWLG